MPKIEKGKSYRIKGESWFLATHAKTTNPVAEIEGLDTESLGAPWDDLIGHPLSNVYANRRRQDGLPEKGNVYVATIDLGEGDSLSLLVHEQELEALADDGVVKQKEV